MRNGFIGGKWRGRKGQLSLFISYDFHSSLEQNRSSAGSEGDLGDRGANLV